MPKAPIIIATNAENIPDLIEKSALSILQVEIENQRVAKDIRLGISKISGLFVITRTSTFTYRGKQVSEDLGVEFILEGSVRKAGARVRVRVTAQLVEGKGGGHVWADRYDRDLTDIFAIQDEIAHSIVDQSKVKLLPKSAKPSTENLEAYTYYLRGRQFLHRHSRPYYILAKRMFGTVLDLLG